MLPFESQEVLVVDVDENVRVGLNTLLKHAGLAATLVGEPERAIELSREKFFAVALVDGDTPKAGEGVQLVARIAQASPATLVIMMLARRTFDVAVAGFRAGAADVVLKLPDQIPYLRQRVIEGAASKRQAADTSRLVEDALSLHEQLFNDLLTTFRKANALEEKARGDQVVVDESTRVLIVDQEGWLESQLHDLVAARGGFVVRVVPTGGEALDFIGRERFQIALVRSDLPDLPGSMVVRTVKSQSPDTIALLYTQPTANQPGSLQVTETSRASPVLATFSNASQIMERLDELRDAFQATSRERRHLAAFRHQHFDLLKRYAELKQRLQRAVSDAGRRPVR